MVDSDGSLHVIDWDEALLAPRERDLMFVGGAVVGEPGRSDDAPFYRGYGAAEIDRVSMAYVRYEWVAQELGEIGELVLRRGDVAQGTRVRGVEMFRRLWGPGQVVEVAYRAGEGL